MNIDLDGKAIALAGRSSTIADHCLTSLVENGGRRVTDPEVPDILLVSFPLLPVEADARALVDLARSAAQTMAKRGGGRIVFLLSAMAGTPSRRHPDYSVEMAAALAGMRVLAMAFGPKVLVNAVGFGLIEADTIVAGDPAMLGHASVGRAGRLDEAVAAVLFFCDPLNSYTTGQMLSVDGGWIAGYGRNF